MSQFTMVVKGQWSYVGYNRVQIRSADGVDLTQQVYDVLKHWEEQVGSPGEPLSMDSGWLVIEGAESYCAEDFADDLLATFETLTRHGTLEVCEEDE